MNQQRLMVLAVVVSGLAGVALAGQETEPVYGPTNPSPTLQGKAQVQRYASVVELNVEKEQEYRRLHAAVWPKVVAALERANIRNYSIYVAELHGKTYLFSYFEYTGSDPRTDLAKIGQDPTVKNEWWPLAEACQRRLPGTPEGEQWKSLEMLMLIE